MQKCLLDFDSGDIAVTPCQILSNGFDLTMCVVGCQEILIIPRGTIFMSISTENVNMKSSIVVNELSGNTLYDFRRTLMFAEHHKKKICECTNPQNVKLSKAIDIILNNRPLRKSISDAAKKFTKNKNGEHLSTENHFSAVFNDCSKQINKTTERKQIEDETHGLTLNATLQSDLSSDFRSDGRKRRINQRNVSDTCNDIKQHDTETPRIVHNTNNNSGSLNRRSSYYRTDRKQAVLVCEHSIERHTYSDTEMQNHNHNNLGLRDEMQNHNDKQRDVNEHNGNLQNNNNKKDSTHHRKRIIIPLLSSDDSSCCAPPQKKRKKKSYRHKSKQNKKRRNTSATNVLDLTRADINELVIEQSERMEDLETSLSPWIPPTSDSDSASEFSAQRSGQSKGEKVRPFKHNTKKKYKNNQNSKSVRKSQTWNTNTKCSV